MNKEDKDSSVDWTYSGKEEEWDAFDRRMTRYMRNKLDAFGEKLWLGDVVDLGPMDITTLKKHVLEVYNALSITKPKEAKELTKKGSDFFKKSWQITWLGRQSSLMVDHIEDHAKGQALVEVVNYGGDKKKVRQHLYDQFGAGSGGDIHTKELEYEKGLPDANGVAFRPGMDITVKLRQLEGRKIYFWKMCEPSKRNKYIFCQESKLVRIVLEHANEDYKACIDRLLDYTKVEKLVEKATLMKSMSSSSSSSAIGSGPISQLDRSFNDDWLPSWKSLQTALTDEYRKFIKDGKFPSGKVSKNQDKLPVAFNAPGEPVCYACGVKGHKSGDPTCKAGPYDVAPIAPPAYRERKEAAKKRKGSNKGEQQGALKKAKPSGEKKPCFDFQKGSCRRGAACRFEHVKDESSTKVAATFSKQQKKAINVMLASAIKKKFSAIAKVGKKGNTKEKESDDDADIASFLAPFLLAPCVNSIPRNPVNKSTLVLKTNLHNVDKTCGIDSDAGMSISTLAEDFLWLDSSPETLSSYAAPSGINGGSAVISGIGPMVVKAKSGEFIVDPFGIYLKGSSAQPNFRVLATQRLKTLGVRVVGCFNGDEDVMQDRFNGHTIKLDDEGPEGKSILVLSTEKLGKIPVTSALKKLITDIKAGNRTAIVRGLTDADLSGGSIPVITKDDSSALLNCFQDMTKVLLFSVAKCNIEERSRLYVRRFGYCDSNSLVRMCKDPDFGELPELCSLNEDNPIKDAAKYRKQTHHRSDPENSRTYPCWGRTFVDGYGGKQSMGVESYEGAIGGYLFRCPTTGETHH